MFWIASRARLKTLRRVLRPWHILYYFLQNNYFKGTTSTPNFSKTSMRVFPPSKFSSYPANVAHLLNQASRFGKFPMFPNKPFSKTILDRIEMSASDGSSPAKYCLPFKKVSSWPKAALNLFLMSSGTFLLPSWNIGRWKVD